MVGTILSIFEREGARVTEPVFCRLAREGSLIRDSEDASYLLFALIDAVGDLFPVIFVLHGYG